MIHVIDKGKHRPRWWWLAGTLGYNKKRIWRRVRFDSSCAYDLHSNDQKDTNKLFGIAFVEWYHIIWIWISWPVFALLSRNRHHQDSVRVGWRWDDRASNLILSAYCYSSGERIIKDVCRCRPDEELDVEIEIRKYFYRLFVCQNNDCIGHTIVEHTHKKNFSFSLGLYFGGNQPAPHQMKLKIQKP